MMPKPTRRIAICRTLMLLAVAASPSGWTPTAAWAQAPPAAAAPGTVPPPAAPPALTVAPMAPKTVLDTGHGGGGKPANICRELQAFVETRETAQAAGPAASPPAQAAPAQPPAVQAQPQAAQSPAQAPAAGNVPVPPTVDPPQRSSGMTAPVPPAPTAAKPLPLTLERARALAAAGDLRACQESTRQMRRAGVAMPDTLIALAALRPDLLEAGR
jgi:hypothetical protein